MSNFMIAESVERIFSENIFNHDLTKVERGEFPAHLWKLIEENGFTRALVSEEAGGVGETWEGAYSIFRGIGYWQLPLPLAETMIASQLLSMAGIEIPDGPMAVAEESVSSCLSLSVIDGEPVLSGDVYRVPWARHCKWIVISLASGSIVLLDLADNNHLEIIPETDHAGVPVDTLIMTSAAVVGYSTNPIPHLNQPVKTLGAAAYSIMMVGALERVLSESVQYANDRVQFGKPIGKNQAVQQQLALMAGDIAASRVAALVAASDMPSSARAESEAASFSAAVAKIRCGEAATRCTSIAHQVHGAIGFTYEHSLHFATRRLWAWREAFGSDADWAAFLGRQAISGRASNFWPSLTRRSF